MKLETNLRRDEIEKFVTDACLIIFELSKQEIMKKNLDPKKMAKIEAGDSLGEKSKPLIFWVKVYEHHPVEIPLEITGEEIRLFKNICNLGQRWPLHIKVTF